MTVGNTPGAVRFLMKWRPNGPWALVAINKDENKIVAKTFQFRDGIDALPKWIESFQGKFNIYFTVNPLLVDKDRKALKADVKEMAWLHVDVDARAGEEVATEIERIVASLEAFEPKPTVIIKSGGGAQAFWKLAEPVPVDGEEEKAVAAEQYNKHLERQFGGDHCHNVDRVMRLPDTINCPDAGKRKKGRLPALAVLHSFDPTRTYELSQFQKVEDAPPPQETSVAPTAAAPSGKPDLPRIDPSNMQTRTSVDDLDLPDWVREAILTGKAVDNGKVYETRSEAMYAVVCALGRHNVPAETALSIITSPAFKISESVFTNSAGKARSIKEWTRYAKRQVERGYVAAHDPQVSAMNESHAVVCLESKVRVLRWTPSPSYAGVEIPTFLSADDLSLLYKHKRVTIRIGEEVKYIPLSQYWLTHPSRRTYFGITFAPGDDNDEVDGCLNLWSGWGVDPVPGDWSLMRNHIREIIADNVEENDTYILNWLAWAVQNPDKPAGVALVLGGPKGTGKSTLGVAMCNLFGPSGMQVSSRDDLVGKFNSHFLRCSLLFADEALWPGNKSDEGPLKRIITEPTLTIEPKGIDKFSVPNHLHIMIVGNDEWLVPASEDERRYAVFHVNEKYQYSKSPEANEAYFGALRAQLNNGGLSAMLHDLLNMDLKDWSPRVGIPRTKALQEQKARSLAPFDQWVATLLEDGNLPSAYSNAPDTAPAGALYVHARESTPKLRDMSQKRIVTELEKYAVRGLSKEARRAQFRFRPLDQLRKEWEEKFGEWKWTTPNAWGTSASDPQHLDTPLPF